MKKILLLSSLFALFTIAASAQRSHSGRDHQEIRKGFQSGKLTRAEKFKLNRNDAQFRNEKRKAFRNGRLSPMEKRKLYSMKRHDRKQTFRYKHNNRRRSF